MEYSPDDISHVLNHCGECYTFWIECNRTMTSGFGMVAQTEDFIMAHHLTADSPHET